MKGADLGLRRLQQSLCRRNSYPILIVSVLAFTLYAVFRVRYVGGSDSYGYYSLALLMRAGRLSLPTLLDPAQFSNLAPLGYVTAAESVIPSYPPGYSVLLAIASYARLEFFVTPLCGLLSIVLLYRCLSTITHKRGLAALFAGLWAFSPIVIWASTHVMSDMVATTFVLAAFYCLLRYQPLWSGFCFALSLSIRPSNVLALPALLTYLGMQSLFPQHLHSQTGPEQDLPYQTAAIKTWLLYGVGLLLGSLPVFAYNNHLYGAPWSTGYGSVLNGLSTEVFPHHFSYYLTQTIDIFTLPLVLLALIPLIQSWKSLQQNAYLAIWFFPFLLFYSFYWPGADSWSYTRFLLVGYPALMILAASGCATLQDRWFAPKLSPRKQTYVVTGLLVAILLHNYSFGKQQELFNAFTSRDYYTESLHIAAAVPADSHVGAIEFSGPLNLYGGLNTFRWDHEHAPDLIRQVMATGTPVYLVIAPHNQRHPRFQELLQQFQLTEALPLHWSDPAFYRVTGPKQVGQELQLLSVNQQNIQAASNAAAVISIAQAEQSEATALNLAALNLTVAIANTGNFTWGDVETGIPTELAYRWLAADGGVLDLAAQGAQPESDSVAVPWDVEPGEVVIFNVRPSLPIDPGHYKLELSMLHNHELWLSDLDNPEATLQLDVEIQTNTSALEQTRR